ncbi:unnamed protein product [Spirodela intermedia]|uniref:Uncharacterized protein n=2 Tax=Spirodela intermedia TaxID=51605 RepID=A0A7I8IME9_SPIIN|nr:unnamed protein product [Spirodela intermedia]CAA6658629.1 unnamed protein product [Spirodela intermedia]CAA7394905.1 unnamed protein product [Spirodela intermedia]
MQSSTLPDCSWSLFSFHFFLTTCCQMFFNSSKRTGFIK